MRIVLTGGGTGGHVYPALAIAEALRDLDKSVDIHFLGTPTGFESKAVPRTGEKFHTISSGGLVGKGPLARVSGAAKAGLGVFQSLNTLRRLKPDAVVGTGGFVMAPVLVAAKVLRIPFFIQEQNSFPGLTTRKFASGARKLFAAYREAEKHLPDSSFVLTGNPLRKSIVEIATASVKNKSSDTRILITGGSLGAKSINQAVADSLNELCELAQVTWQYGRSGVPDSVSEEQVESLTRSGRLVAAPFFEDMPQRYAQASFVICRAGAMTLSEIALFGLPAILIPFPHAAHDHQTTNAAAFETSGAAQVISDDELSPAKLLDACISLNRDFAKRNAMSIAMIELSKPDAARTIAQQIYNNLNS
jgi:UDP-N-acetylglucosamine--N-acetylmuramyl-(pentapeptide) pyrophosphoryl-undecaprenol N-acetylglucosamine transferase